MRAKAKNKTVEYRKHTCHGHHDEEEKDIAHQKFTMEQLKSIHTIHRINKNSFKDLSKLLSDGKGHIPIFGYPLICYSPNTKNSSGQTLFQEKRSHTLDGPRHSLWQILSQSIQNSLKPDHQLLIKELLDSHDDLQDNYEQLLTKFSKGKTLAKKEGHDHGHGHSHNLRVSKRGTKERPVV